MPDNDAGHTPDDVTQLAKDFGKPLEKGYVDKIMADLPEPKDAPSQEIENLADPPPPALEEPNERQMEM